MTKAEKLKKIIARAKKVNPQDFQKTRFYSDSGRAITTFEFGKDLNFDVYNGLIRVRFKGEIVDHYHGETGYVNPSDDGRDQLWALIKEYKKAKENLLLSEL